MGLSSQLSEFLLRKAEAQGAPVLDVRFEPDLPTRILDADEPHDAADALSESANSEGQTFVIGYTNSQGVHSSRRIVMRALKRTSDLRILLVARCAETRKMMGFQADRIRYCVDINGDRHEPPATFLAEIFGLDPVDARLLASEGTTVIATWPPADQTYSLLREQLRHELTLLVAMSESDGQVSLTESEAIVAYARQRATTYGIDIDAHRLHMLQGFIRRLRPTPEQIRASIDDVNARPAQAQLDVLAACNEVMLADGDVRAEELALLEEIRSELLKG
ncbi:MAG: hypothetical protein IPK75_09360 [Acidobacteria bacterium]|jgi:uncharacterized tellurite resistance protein B-like protein|nr:hypothetical protein [Acidobacteriota bacterium]